MGVARRGQVNPGVTILRQRSRGLLWVVTAAGADVEKFARALCVSAFGLAAFLATTIAVAMVAKLTSLTLSLSGEIATEGRLRFMPA